MPRVLTLGLFLWLLSLVPLATAQDIADLKDVYTYHQVSGNRFIDGQGVFPNVIAQDFFLGDTPFWIVGRYLSELTWGVALNHQLVAFKDSGNGLEIQGTLPLQSTAGVPSPPTIQDPIHPVFSLQPDASPLSDIAWFPNRQLYVTKNGELVLWHRNRLFDRLPLNVLPDARLVVNDAGQIAVYTQATDQRYVHGVVGDEFEAAALTVLDIKDDQLNVIAQIDLPDNDVFEGIAPFWADIDQDGADDLVATVSNGAVGAQVRAYRADGSLLATGPAIGRGGRWRHQLAFGPFGPNGEQELVDVLTPHIGGVVEFYRHNGDHLEIVASLPGYTSHVIGSRNLDMAVAGDFNGDGQPEIVLPTQDRTSIAGLQRTADGVQEVWRLPLDGVLSTNLSAVTLPDHTLALAAGTVDGRLRIWLPSA